MTQLEIMPRPSNERPANAPWPMYPMIYRVSSAHEEGGVREYAVSTQRFIGTDKVEAIELVTVEFKDGKFEPVAGSERIIPADAVFLEMGFLGPEQGSLIDQFGFELDARGNIARDASYKTSVDGVYVAGDAGRGQSLIVWAIAEGRSAASHVDAFLTGSTNLPAPIPPTARPLGI